MAIQVIEKWDSRVTTEGDNPEIEQKYIILGTSNDIDAKVALWQTAPTVYDGLVRDSLHMEPTGPDTWEASVRYVKYKRKRPPSTGDSVFSFDTGGGMQRITQSIQTVQKYPAPGRVAPDFQGAIGVTGNEVQGVDRIIPVYNFSETHYLEDSFVSQSYRMTLFNLTGTVNSDNWRGFAPGELLFLGASGSKRGNEDWEITYRFSASPNRTMLSVGPITGISKKGWEYLWVLYEDQVDTQAEKLVKRPIAVYVEQIYFYAFFSALGI